MDSDTAHTRLKNNYSSRLAHNCCTLRLIKAVNSQQSSQSRAWQHTPKALGEGGVSTQPAQRKLSIYHFAAVRHTTQVRPRFRPTTTQRPQCSISQNDRAVVCSRIVYRLQVVRCAPTIQIVRSGPPKNRTIGPSLLSDEQNDTPIMNLSLAHPERQKCLIATDQPVYHWHRLWPHTSTQALHTVTTQGKAEQGNEHSSHALSNSTHKTRTNWSGHTRDPPLPHQP